MQEICNIYAVNMQRICGYIDFNIANMQKICKKYAKNMLNMQQKYAINMHLICRICISLCICIFCIYMHSPLCWCYGSRGYWPWVRWLLPCRGRPCMTTVTIMIRVTVTDNLCWATWLGFAEHELKLRVSCAGRRSAWGFKFKWVTVTVVRQQLELAVVMVP